VKNYQGVAYAASQHLPPLTHESRNQPP